MAEQFRVLISGQTISGVPLAELRDAVGRAFNVQGEALDRMLSGRPLVVSRSCSAEAAEKLHGRLCSLGLEARIEPLGAETVAPVAAPPVAPPPPRPAAVESAGADELFALAAPAAPAVSTSASASQSPAQPAAGGDEVLCPKCGEAQPKRTLCRKCGLDMPRYLAAQEALEREAREERAAQLAARQPASARARGRDSGRGASGDHASLLGMGFSGRLGRLDYLAGSMLSTGIWILFVILAVATGKPGLGGFGLFVAVIYGLRCLALRLHDTGRTGWLALVGLVPVIGGIMALILLFVGGWEEENDYGPETPGGGGIRAILVILVVSGMSSYVFRSISKDPQKALLYVAAMAGGQNKALADDKDDKDDNDAMPGPAVQVRYAPNNRIDIYVIAGCTSCDQMRSWLDANGLRYTVYTVDTDQGAAERLHSITSSNGQSRIMLPVLEVNGKVLPGDPSPEDVHRQLRQETS